MMTKKYFGTDGIRGLANQGSLTVDLALQLGKALAHCLPKQGPSFKALIGKDPRLSGYMFEAAIAAGVNAMGGDVMFTGPLPTPAIAHLTSNMRCDAGVVISASHNPYHDNGLKIFGADGFKLPDELEHSLERYLEEPSLLDAQLSPRKIGRSRRIDDAAGRYISFLKMIFPRDLSLHGLKIVLDCANGAAYKIAPTVLWELGADIIATGVEPNGFNINDGVGALHPEHCADLVLKTGADLGISLDGDADRLIMIDERGNTVDGDFVMAILAKELKDAGRLNSNCLVTTLMSNLGLHHAMRDHGIETIQTKVGDRYVVEAMREKNLIIGGEQSGHIVLFEHSTTGDGLVAALKVLAVMQRSGQKLSQLAKIMRRFPQCLINFRVDSKPDFSLLVESSSLIARLEKKYGEDGRILVRYSGTEPKCRVMIEGKDQDEIQTDAQWVADTIAKEILALS
jgi:phosphoglucosamine mutase